MPLYWEEVSWPGVIKSCFAKLVCNFAGPKYGLGEVKVTDAAAPTVTCNLSILCYLWPVVRTQKNMYLSTNGGICSKHTSNILWGVLLRDIWLFMCLVQRVGSEMKTGLVPWATLGANDDSHDQLGSAWYGRVDTIRDTDGARSLFSQWHRSCVRLWLACAPISSQRSGRLEGLMTACGVQKHPAWF